MNFYDEVVSFLKEHANKQGNLLPAINRKKGRSNQLFARLSSGELETDEEAAQHFFGVWDHKYLELRGRFVRDIITSTLAIDWSSSSNTKYQITYYSLLREIAVAKIFSGKWLVDASLFFMRRCYQKSKQFGFYDILEESTALLRLHYATRAEREREFLRYDQEYHNVLAVRDLERVAERHFCNMTLHQKKNKSNLEASRNLYESFLEDLLPHLEECDSLKFQLYTRIIRLNINSLDYDYYAMLANCTEDINFFLDYRVLHTTALNIFLIQKTMACIRLGEYQEGLNTITQSLEIEDTNSLNWFSIKHNEFFLYMQSEDYESAYHIYQQVIRNRKYGNLNNVYKEPWLLGEVHLYYLIELGMLKLGRRPKAYRVGRFLNSVPEFSKDKRVQNIPILIIQILFMLLRRRTNEAIDRIEAIEKYCSRHLRYNEAVRSNAFIKMLLEIPKNSFRKAAVVRKVERYQKKLAEVPLHQSGKNFDLELIPYERLWEYVLSSLK